MRTAAVALTVCFVLLLATPGITGAFGPGGRSAAHDPALAPRELASAHRAVGPVPYANPDNWSTYLQNPGRTAANLAERTLSPSNASQLTQRWKVTTNGSDFGSPTVNNGTVYAGSWNGYEYAINATNGSVLWKTFLGTDPGCAWGSPMGVAGNAAIWNNTVFVGGGNDYWYALDANNGTIAWKVNVSDTSNGGYNWASPLLYDGYEYIGVASCIDSPLVQGHLLMVNLTGNHSVVHRFNFVPNGQLGATIWTTPAVDAAANVVWVATGNDDGSSSQKLAEAIVALNATNLSLIGAWQVPGVTGGDYDFGGGPILFHDASGRKLVGAENKNGVFYALNRSNVTSNGSWKPVWSLSGVSGFSPEAFDGTTLYVGGAGSVIAVYPSNGTTKWTSTVGGTLDGGLAYADGLVVAGAGSTVSVLNASDGAYLANLTVPSGQYIDGASSIADGQVYYESGDDSTHGAFLAAGIPLGAANASATPTNGSATLSVDLRATIAGGLPPYNFTWNFGDQSTGWGGNVTHLYASAGTFNASVVVRDERNATATASTTVVVTPALAAAITATPRTGAAPLNVTLVGRASNGSGAPYAYSWTFGNGTVGGATGVVVHHLFELPGRYDVNLTVADRSNRTVRTSLVEVVTPALSAAIEATPTTGPAPLAVTFAPNVEFGTPPYRYVWSFGDGSPNATGANQSHTYLTNGSFYATLNATDAAGVSRVVVQQILVTAAPRPLVVGFSEANRSMGCPKPSFTTTVTANTTGGSAPYNDTWSFGDHSAPAFGAVANHTYAVNGTYDVELYTTDAGGNLTMASSLVVVGLPNCATTPPPMPTQPHSLLTPTVVGWGIGAGVVLVLVGVVAIVWARRRRGSPPP